MKNSLRQLLNDAATQYETAEFIGADPIQFPHRYSSREDIEVSAFISAWMAYGSRKVFLNILDNLHKTMDSSGGPYSFIIDKGYYSLKNGENNTLYRFYKWSDFISLAERIRKVLLSNGTLEADDMELRKMFNGINGIPLVCSTSANKRLHMFLRWMVRVGSPVDFGLWDSLSPSELIIPLDTHVYQESVKLGLTSRKCADIKTASEITDHLKEIWPDDPVRGDFALYGIGINKPIIP
ncbi:MAG: TIGR02757 family protein [Bacteroidaceae bacterium]|nr:TIGR02757 family protein [Bacteroidaceae bacterium]